MNRLRVALLATNTLCNFSFNVEVPVTNNCWRRLLILLGSQAYSQGSFETLPSQPWLCPTESLISRNVRDTYSQAPRFPEYHMF
jgi:hypothetical protein